MVLPVFIVSALARVFNKELHVRIIASHTTFPKAQKLLRSSTYGLLYVTRTRAAAQDLFLLKLYQQSDAQA
jgi:hypothetical protein